MQMPVRGRSAETVLVVDDDAVVRSMHEDVLRRAGFACIPAGDGREALEVLRRHRVAAVLLDDTMPVMSGIDVLRRVRADPRTQTLPVILVTGHAEMVNRVAGLDAGASDYLVKPVDPGELIARVRAQLRGQAAWTRVVEEQLGERAAITGSLCRLRVEATPELTAAVICREVTSSPRISSAALVFFAEDGTGVLLARSPSPEAAGSPPVAIGRPLGRSLSRTLRRRGSSGPWTEERSEQPPGALGIPLADAASPVAAFAPLRSGGALLGILVIGAEQAAADDGVDLGSQTLSAAIDFAAVAGALLAPALEQRGVTESLRAELQWILGGQAFTPVFQPICEVPTRDVVGYEVLTRFADGAPPEPRFAEAAQLGMGSDIEAATMAAAVAAAAALPPGSWLSVNVSPPFLMDSERLVALAGSSPRPLVIELTEHDPIDDYPAIRAAFERLGPDVGLSVDDAGTGYACLNHVLSLRPEFVKLDRGWVHGIDTDPARQALVAGLEHFTSSTDCRMIAEGVETPEELQTLVDLGVELAQGFLLGRPAALRA